MRYFELAAVKKYSEIVTVKNTGKRRDELLFVAKALLSQDDVKTVRSGLPNQTLKKLKSLVAVPLYTYSDSNKLRLRSNIKCDMSITSRVKFVQDDRQICRNITPGQMQSQVSKMSSQG